MLMLIDMDKNNTKYNEQLNLILETQQEINELNKLVEEDNENYADIEKLAKKILMKSPEHLETQKIYAKSLINSEKYDEIILFINNNIGEENKKLDIFNFYLGKALYYTCELEESYKILDELKKKIKKEEEEDDKKEDNKMKDEINDLLSKEWQIITFKKKADQFFQEENYEEAYDEYNYVLDIDEANQKFNSLINSQIKLCKQKTTKTNNKFVGFLKNIGKKFKKSEKPKITEKEDKKDKNEIKEKTNDKNSEIPNELVKFLKCFPCVLKMGDNNNIESYNSCLNEISKNKIEFNEENKFTSCQNDKKDNYAMVDDNEASLGISFFHNDANFKLKNSFLNKYERNSSSFIVKRKLYSITIK